MPSVPAAQLLTQAIQVFKRLSTIQPKEAQVTVGLDVGSVAVKVVVLGPRKPGGARPVIGQALIPLAEGHDTDASPAIKSAVAALPVPVHRVNVAVSGPWVIMRIVEMPTMKPAEMKKALPFEAQRYLPFNAQDVVIDGVALGPADAHKVWMLIVAGKKELIERRIDWTKRAGLEVALIDVDALALANAFLASGNGHVTDKDKTKALINVGGQLTNVVVFKGDSPYLVRDIPWGGEKLIRGIAEQRQIEEDAARKELTRGAALSPETASAMKAMSEPLVTELQLSFDYFENRFGQPPEELLVTGGVGQSAEFLQALTEQFTQTVSPWAPIPGLSGQFAVAYGLALRSD